MNTDDKVYLGLEGIAFWRIPWLFFNLRPESSVLAGCKIHDHYDERGRQAVEIIKAHGYKVWVDYKLHDIPRTVGSRAKKLFENGADIITVMAKGGHKMVEEAVLAAQNFDPPRLVYVVTVLTSLTEEEYGQPIGVEVESLAKMAIESGAKGVVCSGQEAILLRKMNESEGIDIIVPGTRLSGSIENDQKRVVTPKTAILNGATHLVVASEVTRSSNPLETLSAIHYEIRDGLREKKIPDCEWCPECNLPISTTPHNCPVDRGVKGF